MKAVAVLLIVAVCGAHSAAVGDNTEEDTKLTALINDQVHAIESSPNLRRMMRKTQSYMKGRSIFRTMGDQIMNYLGYGSEDYDDYDESEYYYPSFDGGVIGGPGSSYSFYNPYGGNYQPARDDNFEEADEGYGWGDFMFDAAIVAVPMVMALAAMPTGIFTVPLLGRSLSNDIEEDLKPFEMPVLRAVENADFLSYTTRECQERVFCEIAQVGRNTNASIMQKLAYFISSLTPEQYAENYGVNRLFKASRDGHCEEYKCVPLMAPTKAIEQ